MRSKQASRESEGVTVTGPGCEGRKAPNDSAGMSLALFLATQQERDCAFYVRDATGTVIARVNREGTSYTTRRVVTA